MVKHLPHIIRKLWHNIIHMSTISINGTTYEGNNIVVKNGKVIIDGKDHTPESKTINISVQGDINELKVDACTKIDVKGSCNNLRSGAGDVNCGDVSGPLQVGSGDVRCGNVNGDIKTGAGDVKCGDVSGNVSSMAGDIRHGVKV